MNDMEERGVQLPRGFATALEFAMKRLGRSRTAANDMKRVAREIEPILLAPFRSASYDPLRF